MLLIDWANKLNYSIDAIVIGISWTRRRSPSGRSAQRLAEAHTAADEPAQRHPVSDRRRPRPARAARSAADDFLVGTRLSLATVVPIGVALMLWPARSSRRGSAPTSPAACIVAAAARARRSSFASATRRRSTLLKGAGQHKLVAYTNVVTAHRATSRSASCSRAARPRRRRNRHARAGRARARCSSCFPRAAAASSSRSCGRSPTPSGRRMAGGGDGRVLVITRPFVPLSLIAGAREHGVAALVYVATFLAFGISAHRTAVLSVEDSSRHAARCASLRPA